MVTRRRGLAGGGFAAPYAARASSLAVLAAGLRAGLTGPTALRLVEVRPQGSLPSTGPAVRGYTRGQSC
ncbi:hypothetical protein [Gordonia polyisoprenivorans]|uniref:hypothetical protein n=1 Tax=Gordonia polyisoprenivorans TaxID=84595 RepID=UPI0011D1CD9B|nr:hypothetical protein [Gordonia polyisoprenivorans]